MSDESGIIHGIENAAEYVPLRVLVAVQVAEKRFGLARIFPPTGPLGFEAIPKGTTLVRVYCVGANLGTLAMRNPPHDAESDALRAVGFYWNRSRACWEWNSNTPQGGSTEPSP